MSVTQKLFLWGPKSNFLGRNKLEFLGSTSVCVWHCQISSKLHKLNGYHYPKWSAWFESLNEPYILRMKWKISESGTQICVCYKHYWFVDVRIRTFGHRCLGALFWALSFKRRRFERSRSGVDRFGSERLGAGRLGAGRLVWANVVAFTEILYKS